MKLYMIFLICFMWYMMTASGEILLPITTILRTPEQDKATVESTQNSNGAFAYRTIEGQSYKTITPLFGHFIAPGPSALLPINYIYV